MSTLSNLTSSFAALLAVVTLAACSDSTSTPSSGGSSSGASSSSGSSSGATGSCSGEITACGMGTLNGTQQGDMCSLILASIDAPAGTKFECKDNGLFLTVSSKEQCVAAKAPAGCKVTVGQLVDCFKSAKKDACGAFGNTGACAPVFATDSGCTP